jgi:intergrase/recombinase
MATGRPLAVKHLRKSFATWAIRGGIDTGVVEDYLGHRRHSVTVVTSRHYLEESRVIALRPHAAQMDSLIRAALRDRIQVSYTRRSDLVRTGTYKSI